MTAKIVLTDIALESIGQSSAGKDRFKADGVQASVNGIEGKLYLKFYAESSSPAEGKKATPKEVKAVQPEVRKAFSSKDAPKGDAGASKTLDLATLQAALKAMGITVA